MGRRSARRNSFAVPGGEVDFVRRPQTKEQVQEVLNGEPRIVYVHEIMGAGGLLNPGDYSETHFEQDSDAFYRKLDGELITVPLTSYLPPGITLGLSSRVRTYAEPNHGLVSQQVVDFIFSGELPVIRGDFTHRQFQATFPTGIAPEHSLPAKRLKRLMKNIPPRIYSDTLDGECNLYGVFTYLPESGKLGGNALRMDVSAMELRDRLFHSASFGRRKHFYEVITPGKPF